MCLQCQNITKIQKLKRIKQDECSRVPEKLSLRKYTREGRSLAEKRLAECGRRGSDLYHGGTRARHGWKSSATRLHFFIYLFWLTFVLRYPYILFIGFNVNRSLGTCITDTVTLAEPLARCQNHLKIVFERGSALYVATASPAVCAHPHQ